MICVMSMIIHDCMILWYRGSVVVSCAAAVKAKYPSASYADLWTLAGATAIKHMGGPQIAWSSGRTDSDKPTTVPDGELLRYLQDRMTI